MKKYILIAVFAYFVAEAKAQNVGISVNGATPNASALLDIDVTSLATKRGLLIPRMTSAQRITLGTPLPAIAQGLVVYQTDAPEGFYYNTSLTTTAVWVQMGAGAGWALTGNAGTVVGTNFLGTTDSIAMSFRVNNHHAGRIGLQADLNTSFGNNAMTNVTGVNNTAFGANALLSNVAGANNTAVGANAVNANSGNNNAGFGTSCLQFNTSGGFNAAIGTYALSANLTGTSNVAMGESALRDGQFGSDNTAIGRDAMNNATPVSSSSGSGNTAVGRNAIGFGIVTSGTSNSAVGMQSLFNLTTGSYNNAYGFNALYNNLSGASNVAMGSGAMYSATAGFGNIAVGDSAMLAATTGGNNTVVGYKAMTSGNGLQNVAVGANALATGTGSINTVVGFNAMSAAVNANQCVAIGTQALQNTATGGGGGANTAVGYTSLKLNTTGISNVGVGINSLNNNTTGGTNTAIGNQAGTNNTLGSGNVYVGSLTGTNSGTLATSINNTFVGAGAAGTTANPISCTALGAASSIAGAFSFATAVGAGSIVGASNSVVLGRTTDHVGIGTTTPSAAHALHVVGNTFLCGTLNVTGAVVFTAAATFSVVACPSDRRFKKNILPMENALDNIMKMQGVTYDWKLDEFPNKGFDNKKQIGFIAQDVEKIFPQMVITNEDGYKAVDYARLTPVLVEAIKELQKTIDAQNKKIDLLSAEVKEIKINGSKKDATSEVGLKK